MFMKLCVMLEHMMKLCKVTEIIQIFQKSPVQAEKVNQLLLIAQQLKHGPAAHGRMLHILQWDWRHKSIL